MLSLVASLKVSAINLQVGRDYDIIPNPPQAVKPLSHEVEVKEFFSFNCIHCKDIESLVEQLTKADKKVHLYKIQVVFDNVNVEYGKLTATLNELNLSNLYLPAFNAIFNGENLKDIKEIKAFLRSQGLTQSQIENFINTYNSFTIDSEVEKYKEMTNSYNINGTPTFIINDKYVIAPATPTRLIEVIEALSEKIAKE
jgi:thiol:disulfide interchange protein DsbA